MKKIHLLISFLALGFIGTTHATVYNCSTTQEIINALASVQAGDQIVIASGIYVSSASTNAAYFYSAANGTAANPITIRSASSSNRAHLKGNVISSRTVLRIEGNYWIVKDLEISYGQKGLVFDNSNYSKAINCKVHNTGNEAIHVRDGSDHVTIDNCKVFNTGNVNPGFGEGIYIGTDKGSWSSYDPYVDYTTVKNCTVGPDVRAEAFDVKEGTRETIIENNIIHAEGISSINFADSFIDLKGTRTYVRSNTFNRNGESNLTKGIAVIDRGVELSSYEHAIHDNTFNMDVSSGNIVEAYSGTSDVHAWANTRSPAGDMFNSNSRVTNSCPSWYDCSGNGGRSALEIFPTSISFMSISGNQNVTVTSNVSWTASDNRSWINLSPASGSNNGTVVVSVGENTSTSSRSGTVTIQGGGITRTVSVSQAADDGGGGPPNFDLSLQYDCGDTQPVNNSIKPYFRIVNDGSSAVSYSDLTIRYYFTKEGSSTPIFHCDYAQIGKSRVNGSFSQTGGSNYYMKVSFDAAAGSLAAGNNSGSIKTRVTKADWSDYNESNDYSFEPTITSWQTYDKITLYQNGLKVWGVEPGGSSSVRMSSDENLLEDPINYHKSEYFSVASAGSMIRLYLKKPMPENLDPIIYDTRGQVVAKRWNLTPTEHPLQSELDISRLAPGLYFIQLNQHEFSATKRFVKY